jgi:CIC family chloride channel protein
MPAEASRPFILWLLDWWRAPHRRARIPPTATTILLACVIGVLGGYGAVLFSLLIDVVTRVTVEPLVALAKTNTWPLAVLWLVPALGLLLVAWFTRRFAPEAQGHGVPEVITAVARHDGVIRPRVALVKILASGVCIGTGGSIGREGPIVQIGSTLGSVAGQWLKLSPRHIKMLVAAGAAAGISATFNAPLAGVMFASEIILGSFAVESLTPIVIAAVLADVVQTHTGEHGLEPAFPHVYHTYVGAWGELPTYLLLGLVCGLVAVGFTKLLYAVEDLGQKWLRAWWLRALVLGALVGGLGIIYYPYSRVLQAQATDSPAVAGERVPFSPPYVQPGTDETEESRLWLPPLFGVGYQAVDYALHLENTTQSSHEGLSAEAKAKITRLESAQMLAPLLWLLPLFLLKPLATSLTLGGGGSGGIFAPSLFIGAALGGSFGLLSNMLFPHAGVFAHPGVYAIVGMGAVVAGTTHGTLSAILIVYEMTGDYYIVLPIMIAAGLSGVVARLIDPESIYHKKLSRRGGAIARAHDAHHLEHVMVRDVMIRRFPSVRNTDNLAEIVRVARSNPHVECLPVMDEEEKLVGIIRAGDLHRVLDTDMPAQLVNADDIALKSPIALDPNENLLEALRDFGVSDVETLPVEEGSGKKRRLIGLLLRSDAMRRYREEMLRPR